MSDEIQFLKKSELFKGLPDSLLQEVYDKSAMRRFGPGEFIFNEDAQSYEIYVIRDGIVEIQKCVDPRRTPAVVAYLCTGECFGEMAMLTGRPRSASARVPEEADILEIPAETFEFLTENNIFLRRLCEVLALRLERTDVKIAGEHDKKELQGDLRYFDIGTVMQTLINASQSGVMVIETSSHLQADVIFSDGKIVQAKFQELEGEEAFYQIFHEDLEGKFAFKGEDIRPHSISSPITISPMNLLLEAFRMKDEIPIFFGKIRNPDRIFNPTRETLVWEDNATLDLAGNIWSKISEGTSLKAILRDMPCCTYHTLSIVNRMLEEKLIQ